MIGTSRIAESREPPLYSPLTTEEAEAIHHEIMRYYPTEPSGVRDRGLLESALSRPIHAASFTKADVYTQTATLIWGLIRNHPFVQGNKRTATVVAFFFLGRGGLRVEAPLGAVLDLAYGIENDWTVERVADWFRRHTVKAK